MTFGHTFSPVLFASWLLGSACSAPDYGGARDESGPTRSDAAVSERLEVFSANSKSLPLGVRTLTESPKRPSSLIKTIPRGLTHRLSGPSRTDGDGDSNRSVNSPSSGPRGR